jgi:hypothetical protein
MELMVLDGTEWSWMEPNGANAAGARAAKNSF